MDIMRDVRGSHAGQPFDVYQRLVADDIFTVDIHSRLGPAVFSVMEAYGQILENPANRIPVLGGALGVYTVAMLAAQERVAINPDDRKQRERLAAMIPKARELVGPQMFRVVRKHLLDYGELPPSPFCRLLVDPEHPDFVRGALRRIALVPPGSEGYRSTISANQAVMRAHLLRRWRGTDHSAYVPSVGSSALAQIFEADIYATWAAEDVAGNTPMFVQLARARRLDACAGKGVRSPIPFVRNTHRQARNLADMTRPGHMQPLQSAR